MPDPSFGFANNGAPPPPGGLNTNPTGMSGGLSLSGSTFPSYPMFGSGTFSSFGSPTPLSANAPLFGTGGGMSGMSSGFDFGNWGQNFANSIGKAYGKGAGQGIYNILDKGLFNPQVADSFLNAMQPSINQGQQSVLNAFGAQGSRFGSAAGLGLSNYLGQANLNEQQTMASMYMQAQQEQLQLLEGILPTLHSERANKSGWVHDLIGGLEIAGGIGAMFVPGLQGAGIGLMGAGAGQIGQGVAPNNGGGGGSSMPFYGNGTGSSWASPYGPSNTGTFGANAPSWDSGTGLDPNQFSEISDWEQSSSASGLYGGSVWNGGGLPFQP